MFHFVISYLVCSAVCYQYVGCCDILLRVVASSFAYISRKSLLGGILMNVCQKILLCCTEYSILANILTS